MKRTVGVAAWWTAVPVATLGRPAAAQDTGGTCHLPVLDGGPPPLPAT